VAKSQKSEVSTPSTASQSDDARLLETILAEVPPSTPVPPGTNLGDQTVDAIEVLLRLIETGKIQVGSSLTRTVDQAIASIDAEMSTQLAEIMHQKDFQKLEGSWRGLHHLVMNTPADGNVRIRVLNASRRELERDFERETFDKTVLFDRLYDQEYGQLGGNPYAIVIGDYEFGYKPQDIEFLKNMTQVSAAAFCPFISAASPELLGAEDFQKLPKLEVLERTFEGKTHVKWRSFRESDDSRFAVLTMPRTLARLPYSAKGKTKSFDLFAFEEVASDADGLGVKVPHSNYCWMNTAFVYGVRLTDAFARTGWCMNIRGVESGGKVEGLPTHTCMDAEGDMVNKCPTEVAIPDRWEGRLSALGLLPLLHEKNTDNAVFIGAQTVQKPKQFTNDGGTANAALMARVPYILAASRIAHCLKILARRKVGKLTDRGELEQFLTNWLTQYVNLDANPSQESAKRRPLREAKVVVEEVPGSPGEFQATAYLIPIIGLESLKTSIRLVTRIKK
jgi:type VI secretion system protein ImpC